MNQSATLKALNTHNGYDPTYTSTAVKCRWAQIRRSKRSSSGDEVVAQGAIVSLEEAVKPGDILTYAGRDYPIVEGAVEEIPDPEGKVWYRRVVF
jgi:hypothetical protein